MSENGVEIASFYFDPIDDPDSANLIQTSNIIVDAKSGVSGANRSTKEKLLFTEVTEGMNSYGVTQKHHGSKVTISFTPHLIPMVNWQMFLLLFSEPWYAISNLCGNGSKSKS
ncbi:hypothetical protein TSUD_155170 [Trifolium subterraneum]|uniref:N-acetyl-gamma-glutamyl-phosphate reductase dimerisation domain-containing protein n=1 Tax=Trifolium subterraneum TaxID=3900 RepID=A0A2Z6M4H4_TRISU|nr:hypothetical protein TSUD_155170 [Trifolium subterraneum]